MSRVDQLLEEFDSIVEKETAQATIDEPIMISIRSDLLLNMLKSAHQAQSEDAVIRLYNSILNNTKIEEESDLDSCLFQATQFKTDEEETDEVEEELTGVNTAPSGDKVLDVVESMEETEELEIENKDEEEYEEPSQEQLNKMSEESQETEKVEEDPQSEETFLGETEKSVEKDTK